MNRTLLGAILLAAISVSPADAACAHKKGSWSDKLCDTVQDFCISMKLQIRSVAKDCKSAQVSSSMVHSKFPNKPFSYKGPAKVSGDKLIQGGSKHPFVRTDSGYSVTVTMSGNPVSFMLE